MSYDIIHIAGKPHVLVPVHDYTSLKNQGDNTRGLSEKALEDLSLKTDNPIKIIRKARKLTQKDLAEAAGISRPYLTEIETGKKDGSIRALKSISDALNVSLEMLV